MVTILNCCSYRIETATYLMEECNGIIYIHRGKIIKHHTLPPDDAKDTVLKITSTSEYDARFPTKDRRIGTPVFVCEALLKKATQIAT